MNLTLTSMLIASTALSFSPAPGPPTPGPAREIPAQLLRILHVLEPPSKRAREQVLNALSGKENLLDKLPLEHLCASSLEAGKLTLRFDFGRRDTLTVGLPRRSWVAHDMKTDRLLPGEQGALELIVREELCLQLAGREIHSIRKGDLRIDGPGWINPTVALRTEHAKGRVARDGEGRPLVELDGRGRVLCRDGRPTYKVADDWVLLTVRGRCRRVLLHEL